MLSPLSSLVMDIMGQTWYAYPLERVSLVRKMLYVTSLLTHAASKPTSLPVLQLHEPFCQPFGNRRLVHCVPASTMPPIGGSATPVMHNHSPTETIRGEIPAWESCGRIVEQERADFYEFFACNLFIAIVAITVLLARSKRLQAIQARQLAARIGLVRPVPAGWASS